MNNSVPASSARRPFFKAIVCGLLAGILAGLVMLCTMGALRLFLGWPTPTELIFDRVFPKLTVEFFISSLVKAGGYTPLKLRGVYGVLTGQMVVAAIAGAIYALYLRCKSRDETPPADRVLIDPRGLKLIVPGVLAATGLFGVLLWPTLITNYRGFPPPTARVISILEMLISFSVCGFGIMFFYALLDRPAVSPPKREGEPAASRVGLRRFLALAIGTIAAFSLSGILRRMYRLGTFSYDGTQYSGPQIQKITPNDKFIRSQKTSSIRMWRAIRGDSISSARWRTRASGHSPRSPQCPEWSRKRHCFAFHTELAAAFAPTRSGKACRSGHCSPK